MVLSTFHSGPLNPPEQKRPVRLVCCLKWLLFAVCTSRTKGECTEIFLSLRPSNTSRERLPLRLFTGLTKHPISSVNVLKLPTAAMHFHWSARLSVRAQKQNSPPVMWSGGVGMRIYAGETHRHICVYKSLCTYIKEYVYIHIIWYHSSHFQRETTTTALSALVSKPSASLSLKNKTHLTLPWLEMVITTHNNCNLSWRDWIQ